jgi:hypothetical protein
MPMTLIARRFPRAYLESLYHIILAAPMEHEDPDRPPTASEVPPRHRHHARNDSPGGGVCSDPVTRLQPLSVAGLHRLHRLRLVAAPPERSLRRGG